MLTADIILSLDDQFDAGDIVVRTISIADISPGFIRKGIDAGFTVPDIASGDDRIGVVLDPDDLIAEVNEGDNVAFFNQIYSITGTFQNTSPVAEDGAFDVDEDESLSAALVATDANADGLTFALDGPSPTNGELVIEDNGDFTFMPAFDFAGEVTFSFSVSDGRDGVDQGDITITVAPVNDAPVLNDFAITVAEDGTATRSPGATDIDSMNLTVEVIQGPANGDAMIEANGDLTDTATVTITVTIVNDAPIADAASLTVVEGGVGERQLTATNIDGPNLTFSLLEGP